MKVIKLIELARPKQWIKNLFVFAPILFAGQLLNVHLLYKNIIAFLAFCGISSIVYIINDIFDIESDKAHAKKKYRPLPSGAVTIKQASVLAIFLSAITIFLTSISSTFFIITIIAYFLLNVLYTLKVKNIVILDVFFISLGFMLRMEGGAAAIGVPISSWMILTTIFISLFLAISKRRAELVSNNIDSINQQRKVLIDYDIKFADQLNTIAATGTIICYALYTVSEKTIRTFNTENLIYTTPFVIYGMFRYLYLIHKKNMGENPEQIVITDIPLILNAFLWFLTAFLIIYKTKIFEFFAS